MEFMCLWCYDCNCSTNQWRRHFSEYKLTRYSLLMRGFRITRTGQRCDKLIVFHFFFYYIWCCKFLPCCILQQIGVSVCRMVPRMVMVLKQQKFLIKLEEGLWFHEWWFLACMFSAFTDCVNYKHGCISSILP